VLALATVSPIVALTAMVWAVDDGEKVPRDLAAAPPGPALSRGEDNPLWGPGRPIELFGLRDEVVAFQIVVEGPANGVRVDVEGLGAIEADRFVEHFLDVRRSVGQESGGSLGWAPGSGPASGRFVGWLPDALIPVEIAPAWSPWPMQVRAGQNGVVWIDLTIPRDQAPGLLHGRVVVRQGDRITKTIPIELEIIDATLPARPVRTWLFYARGDLRRRVGSDAAVEAQLLTLLHRHRVTGFDGVASVEDLRAALPALDGSLYSRARGYRGPAEGVKDDVIVLGTYGVLGDATPAGLRRVEAIADEIAADGLFDSAEVILYAEDEDCASTRGGAWRARLASSANRNARRVRVAWTCSDDPARQPVDIPIVAAIEYDPAQVRAAGKETWIYNGYRPATGALLTDTEATSLRTFGWIAAMADISRWFIWNANAWYDSNPGGHGAFDPFATAISEHKPQGGTLMGDGLLLYPGRQLDAFTDHSLGFAGVVPSIRLKNLRRGIEDAGYLQLARAASREEAEAIARALLPRILAEARFGDPPSWGEGGGRFFQARRALARLIAPGGDPGPARVMGGGPRPRSFHLRWRHLAVGVALGVALFVALFVALRGIRRRRRRGGPGRASRA
jgi:hypothetical protein